MNEAVIKKLKFSILKIINDLKIIDVKEQNDPIKIINITKQLTNLKHRARALALKNANEDVANLLASFQQFKFPLLILKY